MSMKASGTLALWLCALSAAAGVAAAQQDATSVYDEQLRVRLDQQAPAGGGTSIDGGGWFSAALFKYDDADVDRFRTLRKYELRLWAAASYQGIHSAYFRAVTGYDDWNSGDDPDGHGDSYEDFEIERAWYQLDVAALLSGTDPTRRSYDLRVKAGRQIIEIGTGLALLWPLDAVRVEARVCDFEIMGFIGRSIDDYPNIDESVAVIDRQDRCFWGVEGAYTGIRGHRVFAYYMAQNDRTSPYEPDPIRASVQDYGYESQYIGVGSTGSIIPNLRYQVELVGETGRGYSRFQGPTEDPDRICGVAFDAQLEYYFTAPMRPKVWVQYLYASGDNDRFDSTTNTVGGNLAGTTDYAFNAFGYRDTGISYNPNVSNLQMWQVGGSFFPFEKHPLLKNLELGSMLFFYSKAAGGGPVSDRTISSENSRWLGWEWDIYMDWRITSDLSLTVRYGAFQPGAAYDQNDECRQFLYAALTYSF